MPDAAPVPPKLKCPDGMVFVVGEPPRLLDFCVERTEVTAAEYKACVVAGHCKAPTYSSKDFENCTFGDRDEAVLPINCIKQPAAVSYCSSRLRRLPRDDEYDWMLHGGARHVKYPWGDEPIKDALCVHNWHNNIGHPCPVDQYLQGRSVDGIVGLSDNVGEWTAFRLRRADLYRFECIECCHAVGSSWASQEEHIETDMSDILAGKHDRECDSDKWATSFTGFRCAADVAK
jgi:formylglycine-generating enzyme required for sulfatase activity